MSQHQKAIERLKSIPKDYTYSELRSLLTRIGFIEYNKGNTSGSRVRFYRDADKAIINLHKPHPGDIMKEYAVRDVVQALEGYGDL
ncbi:MAG: type II toxin-antitoxin system HicA family toxin [Oscillospiraceae bacterium]|nr:type II toxin-antitoxin system HicA family toxin [Oscillospiraceae bacterium]